MGSGLGLGLRLRLRLRLKLRLRLRLGLRLPSPWDVSRTSAASSTLSLTCFGMAVRSRDVVHRLKHLATHALRGA